MSRIGVLHVITRLEPGGAQRNTLHTVATLDRAEFRRGLAWGPGGLLDANARELADVERYEISALVRPPRPLADVRAYRELRAAIRSFAPAIVHTHSSKAGVLGRLAARREGVRAIVHSIHGFGFTPLQPLPVRAAFLLAERAVAGMTDRFVAVSRANLEEGIRRRLFPPERAVVIRSGIDLDRFRNRSGRSETRRRLGLPDDASVVTQIGNFKPQKGPLDFVRAAVQIAERVPAARFVMTGDGPLRARCEEAVRTAEIGDRFVFPGWFEDVPGLLAATDVVALTSLHEGLPRAVVEALAAGVPVVASAVDGVPEVVRDGVNGYLVPARDPAAIADRLIRILENPELRRTLASAAPRGLEEFDIDDMVRRQEELYRCVLS